MGADPEQVEAATLRAHRLRIAMAELEVSSLRPTMPFAERLVNHANEPLTLEQYRERVAAARQALDGTPAPPSLDAPERGIERTL